MTSSPSTTNKAPELKHMTSQTALSPTARVGGSAAPSGNRISQHLRTSDARLGGSKSPTSIPSSPTSIRSSSSAIFERDIEPIMPPSPPTSLHPHHHHHTNPHRIPRAKGTEALEQAVPSVLDSAAAILGGLEDVEVVAPAATPASASSLSFEAIGRTSGFASPIGSFRSRSPSPHSAMAGQLLSVPVAGGSQAQVQTPASVLGLQLTNAAPVLSSSPPRPQLQTSDTASTITGTGSSSSASNNGNNANIVPSITTPTADLSPATSASASPRNNAPLTLSPTGVAPSSPSATSQISYPPSPIHLPKKRLSFMSYSDLISSTPASTQPLSSLTTCASASSEPPHIPSVSGLNVINAIHAHQTSSAAHSPVLSTAGLPSVLFQQQSTKSATPSLHVNRDRDSVVFLDNVGGEWERQGLGKGLEERLEALVLPSLSSPSSAVAPQPQPPHQPAAVIGGKA
ncbi:hypothetical protein D9613_012223 [Agrocybe pediades]|uniref:Uncharacterized protein n=1 Tax=Agrocybe pediades TaxID=84607 RepID=A0A8H4QEH7_9AGAR|nr:hypothetical protein D9613_012223 [Agrocybe pediades]